MIGALLVSAPVFSQAAQRIVSLKPNVTEILFAMGAGEQVVGVTSFCDYPPEARRKAKVGGYINPTLEAILALKPDLVVGEATGAASAVRRLQDLKVPTMIVSFRDLAQIEAGMLQIATAAGREKQGQDLVARFHDQLQPHRDPKRRVRVLLIIGRDPLFAVGPGGFISEIIERAGGDNVMKDAGSAFSQINAEAIFERAPEVIIDLSMGSEGGEKRRALALQFWKNFDSVPAVRNHRVYFLDPDLILRPGPRLPLGLEALRKAFYPAASP